MKVTVDYFIGGALQQFAFTVPALALGEAYDMYPNIPGLKHVRLAAEKEDRNMGKFFDEFKDERPEGESLGGDFLSGKEKEVLIEEGTAFEVVGVTSAETKFGPRWVCQIVIENESRALGFSKGKVGSRDRMMVALNEHLGNGGEPPLVKIVLRGRSQILVDAEEE